MADQIEQGLRTKPLQAEGLQGEVREFLNRELLPLLRDARAIVNRRFGRDVSISDHYFVQVRDETIFVDASGGAVNVILPSSVGWRRTLYIVLAAGSSMNLVAATGETLDGASGSTAFMASVTLRPQQGIGFWTV